MPGLQTRLSASTTATFWSSRCWRSFKPWQIYTVLSLLMEAYWLPSVPCHIACLGDHYGWCFTWFPLVSSSLQSSPSPHHQHQQHDYQHHTQLCPLSLLSSICIIILLSIHDLRPWSFSCSCCSFWSSWSSSAAAHDCPAACCCSSSMSPSSPATIHQQNHSWHLIISCILSICFC